MRFAEGIEALKQRVLTGSGRTTPEQRRAAFDATDVDPYLAKVRLHAYKTTDADMERLKSAGYTEDQIFELTIAAALGAALKRYDAGMKAMER